MKNRKISRNTILFLLPFVLVTILRMLMGYFAGAWFYAEEFWDDALMARYSEVLAHFMYPNASSLLKYMAYPLFLSVVGISHIPVTLWISGLWLTAGYLCYYVSRKLGLGRYLAFGTFVYMSFVPEAFEKWCGTRLYRNAVVGPFAAISLLLMIVLFFKLGEKEKTKAGNIILSILTGLVVSFTYFIKEDGVWILACLLFAMLLWAIRIFMYRRQNKGEQAIKRVILLCIPFLCLILTAFAYKGINYKSFGVFETNTRTAGESGKFLCLVYKIESPNRNAEIWAPIDAIEKAFSASKTLNENPEFLECIKTSEWLDGDVYTTPIHGDFLGWVVYSAGLDSGIWSTDMEKEAFFRQVNAELEEAFKTGKLNKAAGRVSIVSSGGSRSLPEILDLRGEVSGGYKGAIFYDGYVFGIEEPKNDLSQEAKQVTGLMADTSNLAYLEDYSGVRGTFSAVSRIAYGVSRLYIVINCAAAAMFFINIPVGICRIVKSRREKESFISRNFDACATWFMSVVFAGIGFLYTFAIGWFSSFLHVNGIDKEFLNFYNVALPVLLGLTYLFTLACSYKLWKSGKKENSEKD